ncbi:MAG: nucleoside phosphorylase [Rhodospirillaceae bacterium]
MAVTGVVVGMKTEAACLAPLGAAVSVVCSGARSEFARARAEALVAAGVTGLLSFGIAGALVAGLAPGTLLLPRAVVVPGQGGGEGAGRAVSASWHRRVAGLAAAAGLPLLTDVTLAGSDGAVTGAGAKATLARTSGAAAVDMESHSAAEVAARHGLPFLILRAIADPADRGIPAPALAGLGPDGETRPGAVALRLLAAPWTLPALLRLAADSRSGLAALSAAVSALGPAGFRAL